MNKLIEYLHRLALDKFYGEITIKFEAGKPVFVRENKSIKIQDLK